MNPESLCPSHGQASASTSRQFGGSGLGLAIVKAFCEQMGGCAVLVIAARCCFLLPIRTSA
jgi:signal transduction histidine kinase